MLFCFNILDDFTQPSGSSPNPLACTSCMSGPFCSGLLPSFALTTHSDHTGPAWACGPLHLWFLLPGTHPSSPGTSGKECSGFLKLKRQARILPYSLQKEQGLPATLFFFLSPVKLSGTLDLQKYKKIDLCCFKLLLVVICHKSPGIRKLISSHSPC